MVKYLHRYNLELNIGEVAMLSIAIEERIKAYEHILEMAAESDTTSREIFTQRIREMKELKIKIDNL